MVTDCKCKNLLPLLTRSQGKDAVTQVGSNETFKGLDINRQEFLRKREEVKVTFTT